MMILILQVIQAQDKAQIDIRIMATININITNNIDKRVDNRTISNIYRNYKGKRQRLYGKTEWKYICIHDKQRSQCRECKGSAICEHDKRRSICRECKGSGICEHDKQRSRCRECKGSVFCEHDKRRSECIICRPDSHLHHIVSRRIQGALGPGYKTLELLGINIPDYRIYLTKLFTDGMTWENYGEWQIDHIIPFGIKNESTVDQKMERCHYTNTQPLWKIENQQKDKRVKITDDSQTVLNNIAKQ